MGQSSWLAVLRACVISGRKRGLTGFYLRAKEQVERRVSELGFDSLQIVHPPLILGRDLMLAR